MVNKQHPPQTATSSDQKDTMIDYVVEQFTLYEQHWQDKFDEATRIYDHWCNKAPKRAETWQNAVHVPLTLEAEQTISPRLFAALFPNSAPVEVLVEGDGNQQDGIVIKDAIKHYFRLANVEGKGALVMSQCTLLGTGYGEESWMVEKKWLDDPFNAGERYESITANRPDFEAVDFFEVFPHPAKLHVKDGLPLIRRRFADAEFIKRISKNKYFSNLKEALDSSPVVTEQMATGKETKGKGNKKKDEYEIIEYWGPWHESFKDDNAVTTDDTKQYWIVIINRTVKIRGEVNPHNYGHPPLVKIKLMEDPKPSWFGVGVGKAGVQIQWSTRS